MQEQSVFFPLADKSTGKTLSNYTSVSGELPFITISPLPLSFDFLIERSGGTGKQGC